MASLLLLRATPVHPLLVTNEKERLLFEQGNKNKIRRLEEAKQSLLTTSPTLEEKDIVHNLFLNTLDARLVKNCVSIIEIWLCNNLTSFL